MLSFRETSKVITRSIHNLPYLSGSSGLNDWELLENDSLIDSHLDRGLLCLEEL